MSHSNFLLRHPSIESSAPASELARPSLYDHRDEFIEQIAPVAVAAIYFGSFSLAPQDTSLARQALFKLSFLHRHFLHPGGLRINVVNQTATLSGTVASPAVLLMADLLARQIEGIRQIKDETQGRTSAAKLDPREAIHFLFATDQTLRSGVQVAVHGTQLTLEGEVHSAAQKNWALQLAHGVTAEVDSKLKTGAVPNRSASAEPPQIDDESLQALVLFRLRLVRDTENLALKVKATRGALALQGKVRTEALRQRVENIARSTLGVRELRSTLSIST